MQHSVASTSEYLLEVMALSGVVLRVPVQLVSSIAAFSSVFMNTEEFRLRFRPSGDLQNQTPSAFIGIPFYRSSRASPRRLP